MIEGWYINRSDLTLRPITNIEDWEGMKKFSWFSGNGSKVLVVGHALVNSRDIFSTVEKAVAELAKLIEPKEDRP